MNFVRFMMVFGVAVALAASAFASDFDGSKRLICATVDARDCVLQETCIGGPPYEIGAPAFLRIDFERKAILGPQRTTPILFMEKSEQQVLLQGSEIGYAWALALDQASGRFAASLTNLDGTFVLFGSCTPL